MSQPIGPWGARQDPRLDQGAHALFQKEGIAFRARNQQWCERCQTGVVPQQRREERLGAGGRQRVEPELRVVRLAAPAVLVLRPIVDQQQEVGRGQALDEAVEQGLRLAVDPVQVLKDQQQRLHLTFAQQHALQRFEGALAALCRV